jgi:hypothetical protein
VYRVYSIRDLEARISQLKAKSADVVTFEEKFRQVITGLQYLMVNGRVSREKATELIVGVQHQKIAIDEVFQIIEQLIGADG